MFGERRVRAMIGAADPVRSAVIPCALVPAADVIARAEARVNHEPVTPARVAPAFRPSRRWFLASAVSSAAAATAGIAVTVRSLAGAEQRPPAPSSPAGTDIASSPLVIPIAYQIGTNAPQAGDHLRSMAARLVAAPHDSRTGRYAFHHIKRWGQPRVVSPEGFVMSRSQEIKTWSAADGRGFTETKDLQPEFPSEEAREYWAGVLSQSGDDSPMATVVRDKHTMPQQTRAPKSVGPSVPLASDPSRLRTLLGVKLGATAVAKKISDQFGAYVVPVRSRAQLLEVLASVKGISWRGAATDRTGRAGVAVTVDDTEHDQQLLLLFDTATGDLLAYETIGITQQQVLTYTLFLKYDNTNSAA